VSSTLPVTIGQLIADTRRRLAESGIAESDLDSRLLLLFALDLDSAGLILHEHSVAPSEERLRLETIVTRRLAGEPVHRIIGHRAFYAHDFVLSPETLEPRPDTEVLVDLSRQPIEELLAARGKCQLVDIGTGSGIIAISLLALYPKLEAIALDISPGAVSTARENAAAAGVEDRFFGLVGDYLSALSGPIDVIVSNPPYIPSAVIAGLAREVREHDPMRALDGGADGLDAYREIAAQAANLLVPDGHALMEIGQGQASDVCNIFGQRGLDLAASAEDLSGTVRALWFRRSS
jgi:release factor glutamine methyltransferase